MISNLINHTIKLHAIKIFLWFLHLPTLYSPIISFFLSTFPWSSTFTPTPCFLHLLVSSLYLPSIFNLQYYPTFPPSPSLFPLHSLYIPSIFNLQYYPMFPPSSSLFPLPSLYLNLQYYPNFPPSPSLFPLPSLYL